MRVFNLSVKVALIALLLFAVLRQDLPQFQGKAMEGRALTYPISVLVIPLIWFVIRRRRDVTDYPHLLDALLGMPFLIDMAGNALDLYDSITWWDDVNHFVNWGILTAAFGQFLLRFPLGRWVTAGLAWGFGGSRGSSGRSSSTSHLSGTHPRCRPPIPTRWVISRSTSAAR